MTHSPPLLRSGQTIGVMAPSSYVEREDIEASTSLMEELGYRVFVHPQTYERHHQSAGTVLQKSLALQGLWQREDIDAIWCAGGGNRALHLLDAINFEKMAKHPKPLIGFSDATALLNGLYAHTRICAYHGQVFKNLHRMDAGQQDHMLGILGGEEQDYPLLHATVLNRGEASGPLIGGNLSLFQYLPQTLPGPWYQGGILFLEDCHEDLSRIDRMLLHLKRLGVFEEISGLVFGQFIDLQDSGRPFGFTLEEIILEHTEDLNIPVIAHAPFGHGHDLYCFPVGQSATLKADDVATLSL